MPNYTKYPPYTLAVSDSDGSFIVKSGDMLSKYHWAIYGNYGDPSGWAKFQRDVGGTPTKISNPNLIEVGWKLYHMPDYKGPGKGGNGGGQVGTNPVPGPTPDPIGLPPGGISFTLPAIKIGPIDIGYFRFYLEFSGKVEAKRKDAKVILDNLQSLKGEVVVYKTDHFKAAFNLAVTDDIFKDVVDAVRVGDTDAWVTNIGKAINFQLSYSTDYRGFPFLVYGQLEASETPVKMGCRIMATTGQIEDLDGCPIEFTARGEDAIKVGLSPRGWAYVASKLGRPFVRAFTQSISVELGTAVGVWIGAILLAIEVTIQEVKLFNWLIDGAIERGQKTGAATRYAQTYRECAFGHTVPNLGNYGDTALNRAMVETAMADILNDMRALEIDISGFGAVPSYNQIPANFWTSNSKNRESVNLFERCLCAATGGDDGYAQERVQQYAFQKACQKMGV